MARWRTIAAAVLLAQGGVLLLFGIQSVLYYISGPHAVGCDAATAQYDGECTLTWSSSGIVGIALLGAAAITLFAGIGTARTWRWARSFGFVIQVAAMMLLTPTIGLWAVATGRSNHFFGAPLAALVASIATCCIAIAALVLSNTDRTHPSQQTIAE